jgi:hypothetical protein
MQGNSIFVACTPAWQNTRLYQIITSNTCPNIDAELLLVSGLHHEDMPLPSYCENWRCRLYRRWSQLKGSLHGVFCWAATSKEACAGPCSYGIYVFFFCVELSLKMFKDLSDTSCTWTALSSDYKNFWRASIPVHYNGQVGSSLPFHCNDHIGAFVLPCPVEASLRADYIGYKWVPPHLPTTYARYWTLYCTLRPYRPLHTCPV